MMPQMKNRYDVKAAPNSNNFDSTVQWQGEVGVLKEPSVSESDVSHAEKPAIIQADFFD